MPRSLTWDFVFVTILVAGLAFLAVDVLFGEVGVDEKSGAGGQARRAPV